MPVRGKRACILSLFPPCRIEIAMNCTEARSYVPLLSLPVSGAFSEELEAVRRHLDECAECRGVVEAETAEDAALSRRMLAVPVPADYSRDLLRQFVANRLAVEPAPTAVSRRRRWVLTLGAMTLALVVSGLLLKFSFPPPTWELGKLLSALDERPASSLWIASSRTERPYGWSLVPELTPDPIQQLPQTPIPVYAVTFQFQPRRSASPAAGTLWMIDADRISDAHLLPALSAAEIRYGANYARLIWIENDIVYLLEADADILEQLRSSLLKSPLA
jgi:hypothetical protein